MFVCVCVCVCLCLLNQLMDFHDPQLKMNRPWGPNPEADDDDTKKSRKMIYAKLENCLWKVCIAMEYTSLLQIMVFWVVMPYIIIGGDQCDKRIMLPPSSKSKWVWY